MKKNIIYIVLLALVATVFLVPGLKDTIKEQFLPVATIENAVHIAPADYDVDLQGINVPSTNLKNFKDKVVFLNFWGTWCPPCIKEWPSIQKLYDTKKEKIEFVLIAMKDEEAKVKKFLKENNYNVPVYIAQSPISEKILPKAFPTTFLLDDKGRILLKEDAYKDWMSPSSLEFVNNLIK